MDNITNTVTEKKGSLLEKIAIGGILGLAIIPLGYRIINSESYKNIQQYIHNTGNDTLVTTAYAAAIILCLGAAYSQRKK